MVSDYLLTILKTVFKNKIISSDLLSLVLETLNYFSIKSSCFRLIFHIAINPTKDRSMKALIAKC